MAYKWGTTLSSGTIRGIGSNRPGWDLSRRNKGKLLGPWNFIQWKSSPKKTQRKTARNLSHTLELPPNQDASDHQDSSIFSRESL